MLLGSMVGCKQSKQATNIAYSTFMHTHYEKIFEIGKLLLTLNFGKEEGNDFLLF